MKWAVEPIPLPPPQAHHPCQPPTRSCGSQPHPVPPLPPPSFTYAHTYTILPQDRHRFKATAAEFEGHSTKDFNPGRAACRPPPTIPVVRPVALASLPAPLAPVPSYCLWSFATVRGEAAVTSAKSPIAAAAAHHAPCTASPSAASADEAVRPAALQPLHHCLEPGDLVGPVR